MSRKRQPAPTRAIILFQPPRYRTAEYWLASMGDDVGAYALREALRSGYQLQAARVVPSIRPAVIILATYARAYEDTEIVDDYEQLIELSKTNIGGFHVDKFLASCIRILADRMVAPSKAAFDDQNIPAIYRALTAAD